MNMKKTMLSIVAVLSLLCGASKSYASTDGTPSTGSFSIVSNSALSAATATGSLAVLSTSGLTGVIVNIGPYQLVAGRDFIVGASTNATAASLAAAINATNAPVTAVNLSGDNTVSLSADNIGAVGNSVSLATSNSLKVSVSGAALSGGVDNAVVSINAVSLVQGRDWFVADVSSNTALALAAGINLNPVLRRLVHAEASGTTVNVRSILTTGTYSLASSAGSALTASQANMSGGSQGLLTSGAVPCNLGRVSSLPTSGYPAGCIAYLLSDPTKIQLSTEAVVGSQSWLAK